MQTRPMTAIGSTPCNVRAVSTQRPAVLIAILALLIAVKGVSTAQVVSDIYNFTGKNGAANPLYVTPAQGRNGKLYGTAYQKSGGDGSILSWATTGAVGIPYVFNGTSGSNPFGGLTLGSDGAFYGTAGYGGSANDGVLFKLAGGAYAVLHEFQGGTDGMVPVSPPIQASDGNLYGTTFGALGGANSTVYKYSPTGAFTTIYQFATAQGGFVFGPLIQGTDGNLYGTASTGGANDCGTIFKLTTSGTLLWYYSFPCNAGGATPHGPLVQASDGNFYGTTDQGGPSPAPGYGTIFKLDRNGTVLVLHSFTGDGGVNPIAGLVQATDGKLYGATLLGGKYNCGALFQITTSGTYTRLYSFPKMVGDNPNAALVQDTNGLLYGTASAGGKFGFGSVYSLNMGLGPFVTLVRYTGKVGSTVQILGQGLTGTTSVSFNGIAATSFRVASDTYMTAVVPSGARTGAVVVTTPTGSLTSNKNFRIIGGTASAARAKPPAAKNAN